MWSEAFRQFTAIVVPDRDAFVVRVDACRHLAGTGGLQDVTVGDRGGVQSREVDDAPLPAHGRKRPERALRGPGLDHLAGGEVGDRDDEPVLAGEARGAAMAGRTAWRICRDNNWWIVRVREEAQQDQEARSAGARRPDPP
jgi:hypothetical protein